MTFVKKGQVLSICFLIHYHYLLSKGKGGKKSTKEEQEKAYFIDVWWRLHCAKNHYFSDTCDEGCPCYTLDCFIDTMNINENEHHALIYLLNELLVHLILFLSTQAFIVFSSTCKHLYALLGT